MSPVFFCLPPIAPISPSLLSRDALIPFLRDPSEWPESKVDRDLPATAGSDAGGENLKAISPWEGRCAPRQGLDGSRSLSKNTPDAEAGVP
jgi:hypothetical protein